MGFIVNKSFFTVESDGKDPSKFFAKFSYKNFSPLMYKYKANFF